MEWGTAINSRSRKDKEQKKIINCKSVASAKKDILLPIVSNRLGKFNFFYARSDNGERRPSV